LLDNVTVFSSASGRRSNNAARTIQQDVRRDIRELLMKSKIRYFPSETVIAKAGDVWHSMYLICHGSIQFFMPPDSGSDWEEDGKSAWQKLETVELLPNVESSHVAQTGRKLSSLSDIGRTIKEVAKKRKESDSFLKTSHEYVMTMERWSMFGEELLVGNGLAICGVREYSRLFVCARVLISGCQLCLRRC
jgi:hypothetical protein